MEIEEIKEETNKWTKNKINKKSCLDQEVKRLSL